MDGRMMLFSRDTGVLLHPTSLPGPWGIGTLGEEAEEFIRWMAASGLSVWQVLPISPPVFGNSPYQALSSFAINPLLLSPDKLLSRGYLLPEEAEPHRIDPGSVVSWKFLRARKELIEKAARRAISVNPEGFDGFRRRRWVTEWSRFSARKEMNGDKPWHLWKNNSPPPEERLEIHRMVQFLLEEQWMALRDLCDSQGIRILGDIPIYAAHDSADVFFNRSIFKLLPSGAPEFVAGVPPDYFSSTGQLWGNPVYHWKSSARTGHQWWTCRVRRALELFHAARVDHFRGFESYWEIPAGAETAASGRWVPGPGLPFFQELQRNLGRLPLVAEDLGVITGEVHELRERCGYPGMTVLQFSLEDRDFSIGKVEVNSVIYTGTHDNDTTAGWIASRGKELGYSRAKDVIDLALSSPAGLAVIPMQDILGLDSSARMNTPATSRGNWSFRLRTLPPPVSLERNG